MAVEVKICGITRPEDAAHAVAHGASRLGVVFAWGPRVVSTAQARAIVAAAGDVPVLGVVAADSAPEELLTLARVAGLRGLQLHGAASDATARTLSAAGYEVWRVAILAGRATLEDVLAQCITAADVVLLEPLVAGQSGGRGTALDHGLAREARLALEATPTALAGGLTPETVAAAIRFVGPDFVDVSSGVEDAPGIKSPERVARFLEAVRDAGSAHRSGA